MSRRIPVILCTAAVRTVETMAAQLATVDVTVVYKPFERATCTLSGKQAGMADLADDDQDRGDVAQPR